MMKAYSMSSSTGDSHYPGEYRVCIDSKVHLGYYKYPDYLREQNLAGRTNVDPFFESCFTPCDGTCIATLFRDRRLAEKYSLPPNVREFLQSVVAAEAKEEIPERLIPFIQRVLSGEAMRSVSRDIVKEQEENGGLLPR